MLGRAPDIHRSKRKLRISRGDPIVYVVSVVLITAIGIAAAVVGNRRFAPEMYGSNGPIEIAEALAEGRNYAAFDLNVNIREIRNAHIARMRKAPEVALLGASHWQEAHMDLLEGLDAYNAHVHRDYYEDMLALTEMFVRHDKLPRKMIISVRDNLFTAVGDRKDHLWLPGAPYARAMAKRLGVEPLSAIETLPFRRWQEVISPQMLFANMARWFNADEKPRATSSRYFRTLDTLLPDGSVTWSLEHRALFTSARARMLVETLAAQNASSPPNVHPTGYDAIDALLGFLRSKGVEVVLAQPPFNPDYFDLVRNTPYMEGLRRVDAATKRLAERHGLRVIGSFDPSQVGCEASMFIDAEHANSACLGRVLDEFMFPHGKHPDREIASASFGMKFDFGSGGTKSTGVSRTGSYTGWGQERVAQLRAGLLPAGQTVELQRLAILENATHHSIVPLAGKTEVQSAVIARAATPAGSPANSTGSYDDVALQRQAIIDNASAATTERMLAPTPQLIVAAGLERVPDIANRVAFSREQLRARTPVPRRWQKRREVSAQVAQPHGHQLRHRLTQAQPRQLMWPGDHPESAFGRPRNSSVAAAR